MKDWEAQHALIHQHNNLKHMRPTPRHASTPLSCEEKTDRFIVWVSIAGLIFCFGLLLAERAGLL